MKDLIEALTILAKYQPDTYAPTHCEHDVLMVVGIKSTSITDEDAKRLGLLGFHKSEEFEDSYISFRFGSA